MKTSEILHCISTIVMGIFILLMFWQYAELQTENKKLKDRILNEQSCVSALQQELEESVMYCDTVFIMHYDTVFVHDTIYVDRDVFHPKLKTSKKPVSTINNTYNTTNHYHTYNPTRIDTVIKSIVIKEKEITPKTTKTESPYRYKWNAAKNQFFIVMYDKELKEDISYLLKGCTSFQGLQNIESFKWLNVHARGVLSSIRKDCENAIFLDEHKITQQLSENNQ